MSELVRLTKTQVKLIQVLIDDALEEAVRDHNHKRLRTLKTSLARQTDIYDINTHCSICKGPRTSSGFCGKEIT